MSDEATDRLAQAVRDIAEWLSWIAMWAFIAAMSSCSTCSAVRNIESSMHGIEMTLERMANEKASLAPQ